MKIHIFALRTTSFSSVLSCEDLLISSSTGELPDPAWREQQVDRVKNSNYRTVIQRCLEPEAGMRADMEQIIDELETFKL